MFPSITQTKVSMSTQQPIAIPYSIPEGKIGMITTLMENSTPGRMSEYDEIEQTVDHDPSFRLIGGYLLMVILIGSVGNIAVIYTFVRFKKLHSPINLLIVNLSASDLLVATTGTPLSMVSNFYGRWLFGTNACAFYGFVNYYCGCISLNSLAAISVFRYIIVVRGNVQTNKLSLRSSVYAILIIHVYTLIFSTPPLYGWNRFVLAGYRTSCDIDFTTKTPLFVSYICYMFIFLFVIPLGLISWSYFKIYQRISQHSNSMRLSYVMKESQINKKRARLRKEKNTHILQKPVSLLRLKTSSTILITIVLFLLAWLPYCIVSLWILIDSSNSISKLAATIPSLFAKSSVMYNPFIYVILNSKFRQALIQSFQPINCFSSHRLNDSS